MTDLIPGKRYRWSIEGTAKSAAWLASDDGKVHLTEWMSTGTLELLPDPLPTIPGSVILAENGDAWQLRSSGDGRDWRGANGAYRSPQQLTERAGAFRVLYVPSENTP